MTLRHWWSVPRGREADGTRPRKEPPSRSAATRQQRVIRDVNAKLDVAVAILKRIEKKVGQ
jgi:hypothetical protein